jgi:hypothetical protein
MSIHAGRNIVASMSLIINTLFFYCHKKYTYNQDKHTESHRISK